MLKAKLSHIALCLLTALMLPLNTGCSKEAKARRYLVKADKDFAAQKYDRAEVQYIVALRANPKNGAAMAGLGLTYLEQGKIPQAYGTLSRAVELSPDNHLARTKLGILCNSLGLPGEARTNAIYVLEKSPKPPEEALLLLVDSSRTDQQIQDSLRRLDTLPANLKGSAAEHMARGSIKFRGRDLKGAEAEYKQATAKDPKSERPHAALAAVYGAQNQRSEAEAALKKAAELAPLRSQMRLVYAGMILNSGDVTGAKQFVAEITSKAPDYLPAWLFLAEVAFRERNLDESAEFLKKVLARDPVNYEALKLNGKVLLARNDAPAAIKQFEDIVQAYGTNTDHFLNLALAQVQNRQENQAIGSLDRAIASYTNNVEAMLLQSNLLLRQGNFARVASMLGNVLARSNKLPPQQQGRLPQAMALLARAQAGIGNTAAAANTYENMRKAFADAPEIHLEAANGLLGLGRTNEALNAYKHFVDASTNQFGLLVAGAGFIRLKDIPSARAAFEKSQQLSPGFLPPVEALADIDVRQGKFDDALARVQREIERTNSGGMPWVLLAKMHMSKAGAITREALGDKANEQNLITLPASQADIKAAEDALVKATEKDPSLTIAYHELAKLWVARNKHPQALKKLEDLTSRTNDLTAQVQIALINDRVGDLNAAVAAYEKALTFAPESIEALNNLASLYSTRILQLDRAQELAEKARRIAPDSPAVADTYGWVLLRQGQFTQALALFEDAAKQLPNEPEVTYHLGKAYYMLGQEQAAKAALESAAASPKDFFRKDEIPVCLAILAIDPAKADNAAVATLERRVQEAPEDAMARFRLASVLERDRKFDQAAKAYETILKLTPNNATAAYRLARIYADHLAKPEEAIETAKFARSKNPDDPEIAHLLGRLMWEQKSWAYAATLLEESARKLPNDPAVAHDLAWAHYSLGRVTEAENTMKTPASAQGFPKAAECQRFVKLVSASAKPNDLSNNVGTVNEVNEVLKADPNYVPALFLSAIMLELSKDYSSAASRYERILGIYPSFMPAARNLAILTFEHLNQDQKAYELAMKARQAFPTDPLLARTLGILLYKRG
jgi:tetratricopeptide (TPR) repeat protein